MIKSVLANSELRKCYCKVIGGSLNRGLEASTMTLFLLKVSDDCVHGHLGGGAMKRNNERLKVCLCIREEGER